MNLKFLPETYARPTGVPTGSSRQCGQHSLVVVQKAEYVVVWEPLPPL